MSVPAKLTLGTATIVSIGIISYVTIKQQNDRLVDNVVHDTKTAWIYKPNWFKELNCVTEYYEMLKGNKWGK